MLRLKYWQKKYTNAHLLGREKAIFTLTSLKTIEHSEKLETKVQWAQSCQKFHLHP